MSNSKVVINAAGNVVNHAGLVDPTKITAKPNSGRRSHGLRPVNSLVSAQVPAKAVEAAIPARDARLKDFPQWLKGLVTEENLTLPAEYKDIRAIPRLLFVTPALAKAILANSEPIDATEKHNRKLRPLALREYAAAVRQGRWRVNGDTLRFNTRGQMFDGYHRLTIIVSTGQPMWLFIITGIPTADGIDENQRRSINDKLKDTPITSRQVQAVQALYMLRRTNGFSSSAVVEYVYDVYKEGFEYVEQLAKVNRAKKKYMPAMVFAQCIRAYYTFKAQGRLKDLDRFVAVLCDKHPNMDESDIPARRLRSFLGVSHGQGAKFRMEAYKTAMCYLGCVLKNLKSLTGKADIGRSTQDLFTIPNEDEVFSHILDKLAL